MIPKVTYGGRLAGLLAYLWGPGKAEEHRDPHIVAGYDDPVVLAPYLGPDGRWVVSGLSGRLDAPQVAAGVRGMRRYVWQCSLSLPPQEAALSDERWGAIAARFVAGMGFAGDEARAGCRWVAVRHGLSSGGNDHVHVVVTLATEEGAPVWLRGDKRRSQQVAGEIESEFGLGRWVRRDGAVPRRETSRPELEGARLAGRDATDTQVLRRGVRAAAAGAGSEAEWVSRMREAGLLVAARTADDDPSRVVGYSVAVEPEAGGKPRWRAGRTVDGDLSLPQVRRRWPDALPLDVEGWKQARAAGAWGSAAARRTEVWRASASALADITAQLGGLPVGSPEWPTVTRACADALASVAAATESPEWGPVSRAADILARACAPRRADPPVVGSAIAVALARVADGLWRAGSGGGGRSALMSALVVASARLVVAVAQLRQAQELVEAAGAAQAAAARLTPMLRDLPAPVLPTQVVSERDEVRPVPVWDRGGRGGEDVSR